MKGQHHLLADVQCRQDLDDLDNVLAFAEAVVAATGLTSQKTVFQVFPNGSSFGPGITVLHLLSESHLAIHTAPNRSYLNLDLFSCREFDPQAIWVLIGQHFGITRLDRWDLLRRHE